MSLMKVTIEYEQLISETSGVCFNIYYAKIRKQWVANSTLKKFEALKLEWLLETVNIYLLRNRIETHKANYQFKYKFEEKK